MEPNQISKMENFGETVNDWKPTAIFAKSSILDIISEAPTPTLGWKYFQKTLSQVAKLSHYSNKNTLNTDPICWLKAQHALSL